MASSRLPNVIGSAVSAVDRAFVAALRVHGRNEHAAADAMPHSQRMEVMSDAHRLYGGDALLADAAEFFPAPPRVEPAIRQVRAGVWEATWPSAFEPFAASIGDRYLARVENRTARARMYFAGPPALTSRRPAIVLLHGYMGGQWIVEETQWPIDWLRKRGLDVVLLVLPFHAARGGARGGSPGFPSRDPRLTNEGFRQAVIDVRTIVRWVRARGASDVGLMGMSLGGYTSALVATVTNEIDFVVPMIPLASIADFAREQRRLGRGDEVHAQHGALERANWIVSPLARPLRLAKERALVIAAARDRITPATHAARIARHFDCESVTIRGGHLLQLGREQAFAALASLLEREGIVPPRRIR